MKNARSLVSKIVQFNMLFLAFCILHDHLGKAEQSILQTSDFIKLVKRSMNYTWGNIRDTFSSV